QILVGSLVNSLAEFGHFEHEHGRPPRQNDGAPGNVILIGTNHGCRTSRRECASPQTAKSKAARRRKPCASRHFGRPCDTFSTDSDHPRIAGEHPLEKAVRRVVHSLWLASSAWRATIGGCRDGAGL